MIPRRVPEISKKNIAKYLNEAGFTHVFKDVDIPATESFVKEIDGVDREEIVGHARSHYANVHANFQYDLEIDTETATAEECARKIQAFIEMHPK